MRYWRLSPPQWRALSEDDRDEMLEEYAAYCPSCGQLREVCSDPTRDLYPQRTMCWPTAVRESVVRRLRERYEKTKPDPETGLHPLDGMRVWVSEYDLEPDDDFVTGRSRPPIGHENQSDHGEDDGQSSGTLP